VKTAFWSYHGTHGNNFRLDDAGMNQNRKSEKASLKRLGEGDPIAFKIQ
jgi:hypothetical protein